MRDPQQGYDCAICGQIVDDEYEYNDEVICSQCHKDLPRCQVCGELVEEDELLCEECEHDLDHLEEIGTI